MNCRIKSAIAYSSNNNNGARWPELNIADVVDQNLKNPGREEYDIHVLSAPTVDITNLNTSRLANNNTETLELQAIESSKNMFNIAQNSLTHNKNLNKVIIMVHTPRFDDNIKAHLASLANSTLSQLWAISPLKEKINVGRHNLHSWDMDRDTAILGQYEDINTGKYDGIHFYRPCGAKDFTESMNNILRVAGIGNTKEYKINHHNITNSNSAICQLITQNVSRHNISGGELSTDDLPDRLLTLPQRTGTILIMTWSLTLSAMGQYCSKIGLTFSTRETNWRGSVVK